MSIAGTPIWATAQSAIMKPLDIEGALWTDLPAVDEDGEPILTL